MIIFIKKYMLLKKKVNPARRMSIGFALIILIGALLLMLPVSSKTGEVTPFITAVFTATSATCVTGLVMVDTGSYYSYFGQAVILLMIQLGGLGFMTILTVAFLASNKRIGLRNRLVMAQTLGMEELGGVFKVTRHVLIATAVFEGLGAVLLALRFIPHYGFKGIWYSIFTSVSAFCNAGFDVFGMGDSLYGYRNDFLVILTVSFLVIIGGLGFIVWEDIYRKRSFKRLTVYSKLVFIITGILLVAGTAVFVIFEYNNVYTIGNEPFYNKVLSSFFQAVTTRTAGFDSIGQAALTDESKLFSVILMMVGGSSASTAGGVKTVTIGIIVLSISVFLRKRKSVVIMGRQIPQERVLNAMMLVTIWFFLIFGAGFFISHIDNLDIIDVLFEVASAYGTTGLSVGVTNDSSLITKWILILYMFFGRVGLMTISLSVMSNSSNTEIRYPEGNFLIG